LKISLSSWHKFNNYARSITALLVEYMYNINVCNDNKVRNFEVYFYTVKCAPLHIIKTSVWVEGVVIILHSFFTLSQNGGG